MRHVLSVPLLAALLAGAACGTGTAGLLPDAGVPAVGGGGSGPLDGGAALPWRFAVVGDTHVRRDAPGILPELVSSMLADGVEVVLFAGDLVEGGPALPTAGYARQLQAFQAAAAPLRAAGVKVLAVRGNHEADVPDSVAGWNQAFAGDWALPQDGPPGEQNLTWSFAHRDALFLGLDAYATLHEVNLPWVESTLSSSPAVHLFPVSHEPAFKVFHADCLGAVPAKRDTLWERLSAAGARAYFSGHDHFLDLSRLDDGDGQAAGDLVQVVAGTGGGTPPPNAGSYDGSNGRWTPLQLLHLQAEGYVLADVAGAQVTLSFRERRCAGTCAFVTTPSMAEWTATSR
ncbi:MAG: hypothetical protein RL653_2279 [Pseudomonadota bacterium]|jgi:hypothetical protein